MSREVVTTTVTKEYDADGKLVKESTETVTEREVDGETKVEHHWHTTFVHGAGCCCATCRPNYYGTWTQPQITWTSGQLRAYNTYGTN